MSSGPLSLRLPATSANLGAAFDAAGLAMDLSLEIEAETAEQDEVHATGRNASIVSSMRGNLLFDTYRSLAPDGPALRLRVNNGIPLGMGCGSSAAALLAGVVLASHFGALNWTPGQMLNEACRREGHPDNVAACFHGGFTVSSADAVGQVQAASFAVTAPWRLLLALPAQGLSTTVARAMLPDSYPRRDAVANVQATALLVAAFAQGRSDLLHAGTQDRLHQPFRLQSCPLLERLVPLAGTGGIHSVTLSGAGPSVLLIADQALAIEKLKELVDGAAGELRPELLEARVAPGILLSRGGQSWVPLAR